MNIRLNEKLWKASKKNRLPSVVAFNRIDGPGSSLDLREFQQTFWTLPSIPENIREDPTMKFVRIWWVSYGYDRRLHSCK